MIRLTDEEILKATGWNYLSGDELILIRQANEVQLKKYADEIGKVLDESDDKLRLALGYVWQALLETG